MIDTIFGLLWWGVVLYLLGWKLFFGLMLIVAVIAILILWLGSDSFGLAVLLGGWYAIGYPVYVPKTIWSMIFGSSKNTGIVDNSSNWQDSYDNIVAFPSGLGKLTSGLNAVTNIASVLNGNYNMEFMVHPNLSRVNPNILMLIHNGKHAYNAVPDVNVRGEKLSIICGDGSHNENIHMWKKIVVTRMGNNIVVRSGNSVVCRYVTNEVAPTDSYLHVVGYGKVIKDLKIMRM